MRKLKVLFGLLLSLIFLGSIDGKVSAQSKGERTCIYPVFVYEKFWGISEGLKGYKEVEIDIPAGHPLLRPGKTKAAIAELTATGKLFEKLGIPIPMSDDLVRSLAPLAEKEKISSLPEPLASHLAGKQKMARLVKALATHYRPSVTLNGFKFRELRTPAKFLHARFGRTPLTVQVVTSKDLFATSITRVFVQEEELEGEDGGQVVLYAFDASGRQGEPLFAVPVPKKRSRSAKVSFQAKTPPRPPEEGSPHAYVLAGEGFQGKITLEVVQWHGRREEWDAACPQDAPEEWCMRVKMYRLAVRDARGQATFSQHFLPYPWSDKVSELYLSPPILLSVSPFPLFAIYSMGHPFMESSTQDAWTHTPIIFQLAPDGELKRIPFEAIDIGGIGCD